MPEKKDRDQNALYFGAGGTDARATTACSVRNLKITMTVLRVDFGR